MVYRLMIAVVSVTISLLGLAGDVRAQQIYGQRLQSRDGQWLLPVASLLLCSDTAMHLGRGSIPSWDICIPGGSPIYPSASGMVIYAGCNNQGGYGCWVKLDHGNGITSAYAHMIEGSIQVRSGQSVNPATVLGQVGWTGMTSFGPHVHFVIYQDGAHVDPAKIFNQSAMQFCDKCSAPGSSPVGATGTVGNGVMSIQSQHPVARWQVITTAIANTSADAVGQVILVVLGLLAIMLWLSPSWVRIGIASGATTIAGGLVVVWLLTPINASTTTQSTTTLPAGDWQTVYQIVIGSEGASCTEDGAHTAGGITQGTYNAWLRSHGMSVVDVCGNLTELQRQAIFYERYWLASGADRLSAALAITYVDHAFNAGIGTAKRGLAQCGSDVICYNNWRVQDYRGKRSCNLYCAGWLNRVTYIRSITER